MKHTLEVTTIELMTILCSLETKVFFNEDDERIRQKLIEDIHNKVTEDLSSNEKGAKNG